MNYYKDMVETFTGTLNEEMESVQHKIHILDRMADRAIEKGNFSRTAQMAKLLARYATQMQELATFMEYMESYDE